MQHLEQVNYVAAFLVSFYLQKSADLEILMKWLLSNLNKKQKPQLTITFLDKIFEFVYKWELYIDDNNLCHVKALNILLNVLIKQKNYYSVIGFKWRNGPESRDIARFVFKIVDFVMKKRRWHPCEESYKDFFEYFEQNEENKSLIIETFTRYVELIKKCNKENFETVLYRFINNKYADVEKEEKNGMMQLLDCCNMLTLIEQ